MLLYYPLLRDAHPQGITQSHSKESAVILPQYYFCSCFFGLYQVRPRSRSRSRDLARVHGCVRLDPGVVFLLRYSYVMYSTGHWSQLYMRTVSRCMPTHVLAPVITGRNGHPAVFPAFSRKIVRLCYRFHLIFDGSFRSPWYLVLSPHSRGCHLPTAIQQQPQEGFFTEHLKELGEPATGRLTSSKPDLDTKESTGDSVSISIQDMHTSPLSLNVVDNDIQLLTVLSGLPAGASVNIHVLASEHGGSTVSNSDASERSPSDSESGTNLSESHEIPPKTDWSLTDSKKNLWQLNCIVVLYLAYSQ